MSKLIKVDKDYKEWIVEISNKFRQNQLKAAFKANDLMLRFYWSVGRDISAMSEKNGYGSGFYKTISADLKDIFPEVKSFSPTNLKYMRYFFEMYPTVQNRQQSVDDLGKLENHQQVVDDSDMDKVEAQYALESSSQPLGVSSYELSKLIPEEFKGSMPTIEEIEAELGE